MLKAMTCKVILTAMLLLLSFRMSSLAQSSSIYGSYRYCPFPCITIEIHPDSTFTYELDGDLYNGERYSGQWSFIDKDRIRATIPKDHSPLQVLEKSTGRANGVKVTVVDYVKASVPGVEITCKNRAKVFRQKTDASGESIAPKCEQLEVAYLNYRGIYKVKDESTDEMQISLTYEQEASMALDQIWQIKNDMLYVEDREGKIEISAGYKRLKSNQVKE